MAHLSGLAHIEPVSEYSRESSKNDRNIELGSLSARASLEANEALQSSVAEDHGWYWRPGPHDYTNKARVESTATSIWDSETPEPLTRMSSRSLLPRSDLKDAEEADMGLHALEPQLSARSGHRQISRTRSRSKAARDGTTSDAARKSQGKPPEFPNLLAEVTCVLVCTMGQLLFSIFIGNIRVNMLRLVPVLGIETSQTPWLDGAFLLANGLSVVIFGSMADLAAPHTLVVGAFAWATVWNVIGAFSLSPERKVLFFIVRAMQGLSIGVLVSTAMSILGRIYNPGVRKTRVFSAMVSQVRHTNMCGTFAVLLYD